MTTSAYDVLIIGGGPAGSSAAAFARQRGLRVLVLEKFAFPRFRIGESMLPMVNALLRETGVWPKIEAAGFIPKYGAEFYSASGKADKRVDFRNSYVPGLESSFQVNRAKFDAILLDHAEALGAVVRYETAVKSVVSTAHGNQVTFTGPKGTETIEVPWVLDACGRDNVFMTEQKRALDHSPFPPRVAIYSHFKGVARAEGRDAGNTIVVRLEDGWFWVIPIDEEHTSVGVVCTTAAFKRFKGTPEEFFQHAVADSAKTREFMEGSQATMPYFVTSDYGYFRRELAQDRLLLVGDAGGFFDPIFSSGVYVAVDAAKRAVELVARAHAENRVLTRREQRHYTRVIKSHAATFQKLIAAFYDNDSFSVFMCKDVPWNLTPGLTSIVAGHAKLVWPLWWRFHVFLLVCKLQRFWNITPPVEDMPHTVTSTA